jgi:hypothetical protein
MNDDFAWDPDLSVHDGDDVVADNDDDEGGQDA